MKKIWLTSLFLVLVIIFLLLKFFALHRMVSAGKLSANMNTNNISTSTSPTSANSYLHPSEVLNLANWKITLPTGSFHSPTEITQPDLASYSSQWFYVTSDKKGVVFQAPVTGVTTIGSNYPRSELREMTNNGAALAGWSSSSGTHTMTIDEAITAVPKVKQQVVAGQIHDASSYVIFIRLDYPVLYVSVNGKNVHTLDSHYTLGKRFTIKFAVHNNLTDIYYNNSSSPVYTLKKSFSNSYFKAGAYTQSNCSTEKSNSLCSDSNFGQVIIYNLAVTHQ